MYVCMYVCMYIHIYFALHKLGLVCWGHVTYSPLFSTCMHTYVSISVHASTWACHPAAYLGAALCVALLCWYRRGVNEASISRKCRFSPTPPPPPKKIRAGTKNVSTYASIPTYLLTSLVWSNYVVIYINFYLSIHLFVLFHYALPGHQRYGILEQHNVKRLRGGLRSYPSPSCYGALHNKTSSVDAVNVSSIHKGYSACK